MLSKSYSYHCTTDASQPLVNDAIPRQANKLDVAARFDLSRPPTISETSRRRLEARRQAAAVAAANGDQTSTRGSDLAVGIPVDQPPTSPVSRAMPPLLAESIAGNIDSVRPLHV